MTQSTGLVPTEAPGLPELTPEEAKKRIGAEIAIAHERASAVGKVIKDQHLYNTIEGHDYVRVEGWTTLARSYELAPDIEWTRPNEEGGHTARARLVNMRTGEACSHAEAECGTPGDGKQWIGAASYAQKSMAQTRAVSKVCRMALSWVIVLAGYEPTPAEEMDGVKPAAREGVAADYSLGYCTIHKGDDGKPWPLSAPKDPAWGPWCTKKKDKKCVKADWVFGKGPPIEAEPVEAAEQEPAEPEGGDEEEAVQTLLEEN